MSDPLFSQRCFRFSLNCLQQYPENSPDASEVLHLCGTHWIRTAGVVPHADLPLQCGPGWRGGPLAPQQGVEPRAHRGQRAAGHPRPPQVPAARCCSLGCFSTCVRRCASLLSCHCTVRYGLSTVSSERHVLLSFDQSARNAGKAFYEGATCPHAQVG